MTTSIVEPDVPGAMSATATEDTLTVDLSAGRPLTPDALRRHDEGS